MARLSDAGNTTNTGRQAEPFGAGAASIGWQTRLIRNLDVDPGEVQRCSESQNRRRRAFPAWAKAVFDERQDNNSKDDPSARCQPTGLTLRPTLATPLKIVQVPGLTLVLYESRTTFRQIFTDGRPHPKVIDWPAWQGFSIGKWEGDTFVVDTIGTNGKFWLDQAGHPATESFHLIERYRRRDFGHMDLEMTIDDPKAYTRPWTIYVEMALQPDTEILEFICEENEKDAARMVGK